MRYDLCDRCTERYAQGEYRITRKVDGVKTVTTQRLCNECYEVVSESRQVTDMTSTEDDEVESCPAP